MLLNIRSQELAAQPVQSMADGFVKFLDNNTGRTDDYRKDHFISNPEHIIANNRHYNYNSLMMGWPNENAPTEATAMAILGFLHLYIASDYKNADYLKRAEEYWDAYTKSFFGGVPIPDTPTYWPDNWVINGKEPKLSCYPINWSIPYSSGFLDVELKYTNGRAKVPYGSPYWGEYLTYAYQAYKGELGYECVKAFVQKYNDDGSVNWDANGNGESHLVDWIVNEDHKKIKFNGNWGGVSADIIEDPATEDIGTIQLVDTDVNGTYKTTFAAKLPVDKGGYEIQRNEAYICWPLQVPVAVANLQPASDATEWFLDATHILYTITGEEKYKKAFQSEDLTLYTMANFSERLKYFRICKGNYGFKTDGLGISYSWSPNATIKPAYTRSSAGYLITTCHEGGKVWLDNKGTWTSFKEGGNGLIHVELAGSNPDVMSYKVEIRTDEKATIKYSYTLKGSEAGSFAYTDRDKVTSSNIKVIEIPVTKFSYKTLSGSPVSGFTEVVYDTAVSDEAPKGAYTNFTCYYPEPTENLSVWGQATASYSEEEVDYGDYTAKGGVTRYLIKANQANGGATLGFWHTYDNSTHTGTVALKIIPATIRYRSNCVIGLKFTDTRDNEWRLINGLPNTNGKWSTWHLPVAKSNWTCESGFTGDIAWPTGLEQISLDVPDGITIPSGGAYFDWARVNTPSASGSFTSGNVRYFSLMADNETDTTWAIATGNIYPVNYVSDLKYCPGTMPYGNNSTTESPQVEAWRGYPYTGYQYPMIYLWSEYADSKYLQNMVNFLYDSQQVYNSKFGVLGPCMQSYYWERWDSVEKGIADTFTNTTFDNSWSGYEPRAFYGAARCYYLIKRSGKTMPNHLEEFCLNWVNFLNDFYKAHHYLPDYFPENGGPTKQADYDDFPIIFLYCSSLCELKMAGMKVSGMDDLIEWCMQYVRGMYLIIAGKPEHVFNGGISQKPMLESELTGHEQPGEFYGYQAGEILRTMGLYMQMKRGIKEKVNFNVAGGSTVEPDPTPAPDPKPSTDPVTPVTPTVKKVTNNSVNVSSAVTTWLNSYQRQSLGCIEDNGSAHSESTGYGMILSVAAQNKTAFDQIFSFAEAKLLQSNGLYAWRYDINNNTVPDTNNATDGDILIAWALLKGYAQWGDENYQTRALEIINAIKTNCTKSYAGYTILLPGGKAAFDHSAEEGYVVVNPCYYIYKALRDFAYVTEDDSWLTVINDGQRIMQDFITYIKPKVAILPNWFIVKDGGTFAFDPNHDRKSGWDAMRCPLYSAWDTEVNYEDTLWKAFYNAYAEDSTPAVIDIYNGSVESYIRDFTSFKAIRNVVLGNTVSLDFQSNGYYQDALVLFSYLAQKNF